AVRTAVVGDQHLALDAVLLHARQGLAHTDFHGLGLVEAGHDHRQFHVSTLQLRHIQHTIMPCAQQWSRHVSRTTGILYSMVSVAEDTAVDNSAIGRTARVLSFLRRHRVFAAAFAGGAVLRIITMLGYGPAMWFNDSYEYVSVALHPRPHPIRPDGYGFWLLLLKPFHSFTLVTFTQHLMGLATAVLIYALLLRKFRLPKWGATLAAAPVLFDAYQIQLEQLIMSDTQFTLLVVAVITLVLWHRRMSWRMGVLVGLLLALTWLTRSIGLPVLALVLVYLLIKRTGWKTIVAVLT